MRCDYIPEDQNFWEEFLMQGYGMNAYSGIPYQRGAGLGGLFRGLFRVAAPIFRKALPFLKNVGLDLGRRAVEAGADIIGDVNEGKDLGDATKRIFKRKGKQGLGDVAQRISKTLQDGKGVGMRPKRKSIKRNAPIDIYRKRYCYG